MVDRRRVIAAVRVVVDKELDPVSVAVVEDSTAGYATTIREGMAMEAKASKEYMATVSAGSIAERRVNVQKRGREQGS